MTLSDFAAYVRTKLAPWRGDIREITYDADGGNLIAWGYVKHGTWWTDTVIDASTDPVRPEWELVAVHINQILRSSAWCHAIAEDYLVGGGMASDKCMAILRALAKRCGKTIDD